MNPNDLEKRIVALEKWKADREKQQITFPLDIQSIDALNTYFMRLTGGYSIDAGAGGHTFVTYFGRQTRVDNLSGFATSPALFEVSKSTTYRYSITDLTNDIATISGTTIADGNRFSILTTDTVPNPLSTADTYFAIEVTPTTFKFSLDGVTPINITTTGVGIQYLYFF